MERFREDGGQQLQQRQEFLTTVLDWVPPVEAAFAYGSGVFEQPSLYNADDRKRPMLDFVFAVESPRRWHSENLIENRHHYSGMASIGPRVVDVISNRIGIGIHFNTLVPWKQRLIKYGVISVASLNHDLSSWQYLYLSGRLQKPVLWLKKNTAVQENLSINLNSALAAALLLLPQRFTEQDLLHTICKLSYAGDIRMNLAEDKQKVQRIAQGSRSGLLELYDPFLKKHFSDRNPLVRSDSAFCWENEMELGNTMRLIETLPQGVVQDIQRNSPLQALIETGGCRESLAAVLSHRVSRASRKQAVAGLFAVGVRKSSRYMMEKIRKAWKG